MYFVNNVTLHAIQGVKKEKTRHRAALGKIGRKKGGPKPAFAYLERFLALCEFRVGLEAALGDIRAFIFLFLRDADPHGGF